MGENAIVFVRDPARIDGRLFGKLSDIEDTRWYTFLKESGLNDYADDVSIIDLSALDDLIVDIADEYKWEIDEMYYEERRPLRDLHAKGFEGFMRLYRAIKLREVLEEADAIVVREYALDDELEEDLNMRGYIPFYDVEEKIRDALNNIPAEAV